MPNFVVSTAFTVKDRGPLAFFKKLTVQARTFGDKSNKSFKKASKGALGFKSVVGGIMTAGVLTRGIGALKMGVRGVVTEFIEFDQAITSAAAKLDVKRGTQQFKDLEKAARQVGSTTEFTATQSAQAIDELVKAGFNQAQAMKAVAGTTDLATIANVGLEQSAAIAVGALNAFGLASEDSDQRLKNLTKVNDIFARTVNSSATDIESLNETMIQAGPIFDAVGSDMKTFATLAGAVARANLKGSLAGTTLKTTLLSLVSITPKAAKVFKKLDIETADYAGNLKDPIQLLGRLAEATEDMGTKQRAAAIDTIFGRRAIAGVSKVLDLGYDWLAKYREGTISTGRTAKAVADDMRQSYGNKLKVIQSTLIDVGFQFIDAFKDKAPGALDATLQAIKNIDVGEIIENAKAFGGFLQEIWDVVNAMSPVIIGVVTAMIAYKSILLAVAAIQIVQGFVSFLVVLQNLIIAQGGLNAVMMANPILAIVAAIALLVTAGVLLYKNWDEIAAKLEGSFKSIWQDYNEYLRPILDFLGVADTLDKMTAVDRAKENFRNRQVDQENQLTDFSSAAPDAFDAPNAGIESARRDRLDVNGRMTFVGAPPGTEFESDFFAPTFEADELGGN